MRQTLTLQIQHLHLPLYVRMRVVIALVFKRSDIAFAELYMDHDTSGLPLNYLNFTMIVQLVQVGTAWSIPSESNKTLRNSTHVSTISLWVRLSLFSHSRKIAAETT